MSIEGVVLHYNMLLFACEEKERNIFPFFLIFSFPQSYSLLTLLKHVSTRVYLGSFKKTIAIALLSDMLTNAYCNA